MANSKAIVGLGILAGIGGVLFLTSRAKAQVYTCPVCDEEFGSLEELQEHFTTSHPREPIPIEWT